MTTPNEIRLDRFTRMRNEAIEGAVRHKTFTRCLDRLARFHQSSLSESKCRCAFVTGETGAGKSTLIEYYASQHPRVSGRNVDCAPVVCVRAPGRSTVKGLGSAILIKLGSPSPASWSDFEITNHVIKLIRAMDVQLLIIDEVQDLLEWKRNSSLFPTLVANFVQSIIDTTATGVVLVGLPNIETIADQERQLAGRTGAYIRMTGLRPTSPTERADFKLLMEALGMRSHLPFFAPLGFAIGCAPDSDCLSRIYRRSQTTGSICSQLRRRRRKCSGAAGRFQRRIEGHDAGGFRPRRSVQDVRC